MIRRVFAIVAVIGVLAVVGWAVFRPGRPRATVATTPVASSAPPPVVRRGPPPVATPPSAPSPGRAPAAPGRRAAAPKEPAATAEPSAAPAMGTLRIDSDVPGAQVFIDRNYIGVTPVTSPEIAPGSHRVNIVASGYDSIAENIDVEPGSREIRFAFKEVRLDAAIDVVHKHRIGSCRGRLVATPQGLRYESDDKGDRFTLPLTDLDVFEVDYLAKVLKVKGQKGKRYEFTDPGAANADRLFVFHREVEKARQRLKQGS